MIFYSREFAWPGKILPPHMNARIAPAEEPLRAEIARRLEIEQQLRNSDARFRLMFEKSGVGMTLTTTDSIFLQANRTFCTLLGRSEDEIIGHSAAEFTHPDDIEKTLNPAAEARDDGVHLVDFEKRYLRKDGAIVWAHITAVLHFDETAQPLYYIATVEDITERKDAEERLREYEKAVEGLEEMIVVIDRDYRYRLANRAFLKYRRMEREELLGRSMPDVLKDGVFDAVIKPNLDACLEGHAVRFEVKYDYEGRGERDLLVSYFPIEGDGGVDRVACILQDITERKRAEEELRRSEEKFKTLFGIAPVGIAFLDSEMNIVDCNRALERMSGLSRKDLLGKAWRQRTFLNADRSPRLGRERVTELGVLEKQHVNAVETGAVMENGDIVWAEVSVAPLAIPDASAVVIMHDITERKRAEERLQEYERVVEGLEEMIVVVDRDYRYLLANRAFLNFRGLEREQLIGRRVPDVLGPEAFAGVAGKLSECLAGKTIQYEMRYRFPDNSERDLLVSYLPIEGRSGIDRVACVLQDITERKCAEEELKREKEVLAKIVNSIPVMIGFVGSDGSVSLVNPEWERSIGWTLEELREQNVDIFAEAYPDPSYRQKVLDFVAASTGEWADLKIKVRDGHVIDVACAVVHLSDGTKVAIAQDITERKRTEQAQERGLSLMLATLESTADGILVVNREGKIETFNRIFARMWRLPDEVLAAKEDARALECVLDQLVEPEQFLEKVSYLYQHPDEESFDRLLFKDGRVFERYSRPQLIGGEVVGRVWSFRDITERNEAREALQKANRQLRSLSRRLFQVQEQEKRHLARELHDEIGQALTAVKINLTFLGTAKGDDSLRLKETIALLDKLLQQVRQISLDLHPSLLDDLGLAAALRSLLDQQAGRAGLRAQFCAAQLTDNIRPAIETTAFRIAQEAITNVLRHAKASLIKVQLRTEAGRLRIEVADDGAGFDVAEATQRSHHEAGFGLMGMKERAALVGGDVEVTSSRDTGTRVQISLPLKENGSTP